MTFQYGKRYTVFSIRKAERGDASVWTRAGNAFLNKDGSLNVYLDVLPMSGVLHVREAVEERQRADGTQHERPELSELPAMGGH